MDNDQPRLSAKDRPDPNAEAIEREAATPQVAEVGRAPDSLGIPEDQRPGSPVQPGPLIEVAKQVYYVADDSGEPELHRLDDKTYALHYEDGSIVTLRLEAKPGRWHSVGPQVFTDETRAELNKRHSAAKKAEQDQLTAAKALKEDAAKAREEQAGRYQPQPMGAGQP
jgi:hypothetical protein